MRAVNAALLSILLGMTLASALPGRAAAQQEGEDGMVEVVARNETSFDVRVYLLQKGAMVPLGLVPSGGTANLSVPVTLARLEEPLQLVADLIGSPAWHKSDPVIAHPATEIEFTIGADLDRSTVVVGGQE
jgi:hypothetical protein